MATPSRTRHQLDLAAGPVTVDVLGSGRSPAGPAVLLVGGLGGERTALRLARAGFTVIACAEAAPEIAAALLSRLRDYGIAGTRPSSLGVLALPLAPPGEDEEAALDAAVRDLSARLT
jgi:NAD(P)-dependent dehydrogenase (short-subunit alcohol dehydrogenase family)